jgi:Domain of Unknown Function (DUF928)
MTMNTKHQNNSPKHAIATCIVGVSTLLCFSHAIASPVAWAAPSIDQVSSVSFSPPPPPPDNGAPGNRGGAAGRGCGVSKQSVVALVPMYQQKLAQGSEVVQVWGTTISDRPTFWFDLPYEKSAIAGLEFVLQEDTNSAKDLYRTAIAPPSAPGLISIHLPSTVSSLEVGKRYQWFLKVRLQCASSTATAKPEIKQEDVYGWVQRVNPSAALATQLSQANPAQQAVLYAQNGIWFDALSTLAKSRLSNPQDARLTQDWQQLLQTVGLEKLAAKPLAK